MSQYKYFTNSELACRCCGRVHMDAQFMQRLDRLRERLAFPFLISSAYRCADRNEIVSTTGRDGPHTTGRAVDIFVMGESAYLVNKFAPHFGFTGIGMKQHGKDRFYHLDDLEATETRPRPWIWSYT